jgi:hypothetical protein
LNPGEIIEMYVDGKINKDQAADALQEVTGVFMTPDEMFWFVDGYISTMAG